MHLKRRYEMENRNVNVEGLILRKTREEIGVAFSEDANDVSAWQ